MVALKDKMEHFGKVKCLECGKFVIPQKINKVLVVCPECRSKL